MTLFGWDASDFDWDRGPMDMAAARADGIDFFTHKATEGTGVKHGHYGLALDRARAAGIPFLGAYIVIRSGAVKPQVDYFLSYLDSATPWWRAMPEFFLQVDLEHWPYDQVAPQQGVVACELLRQASGKWVVLYAPQWAYGNTIDGSDPLWASAYGGNPAGHYRAVYPGDGDGKRWQAYSGRTPVFLQYGSATRIGTQNTCDANAFRGSLADLRQLITGTADLAPAKRKDDDVAAYLAQDATGIAVVWTGANDVLVRNIAYVETVAAWNAAGVPGPFQVPSIAALGTPAPAANSGPGGGPTLAQIEKAVDRQLDQQSLGGADKDN